MERALQDKASLRSGRNFGILTVLAVAGFVALVVIEKTASIANLRSGMSEAAAGLMAATLAVIVSHLSHQQGRAQSRGIRARRESSESQRTGRSAASCIDRHGDCCYRGCRLLGCIGCRCRRANDH